MVSKKVRIFARLDFLLTHMEEQQTIQSGALAERVIRNLQKRHYEAYYCHDVQDLRDTVRNLIPEGSSVTWGGSATIRDTGVTTMLKAGNYEVYDRDDVKTSEEKVAIYRKAFECDYYLSGINAISESGIIVNIDGNGNRVAAITWGPKHVILVAGLNKVCPDTESAIRRAREVAAPLNMKRFNLNTPCAKTGLCQDCLSPDSICNYFSILRQSHPAGRIIVILVDGVLGY